MKSYFLVVPSEGCQKQWQSSKNHRPTGLFQKIMKKTLRGLLMGRWGIVVRFIEAGKTTKDCCQVPGVCVSSMARWFSYIPLWKKFGFVFTKKDKGPKFFCHQFNVKTLSSSVSFPILPALSVFPATHQPMLCCRTQAYIGPILRGPMLLLWRKDKQRHGLAHNLTHATKGGLS